MAQALIEETPQSPERIGPQVTDERSATRLAVEIDWVDDHSRLGPRLVLIDLMFLPLRNLGMI